MRDVVDVANLVRDLDRPRAVRKVWRMLDLESLALSLRQRLVICDFDDEVPNLAAERFFQLGGQINSAPMSYAIGGRQFIAIAAGSALFAFALPEE
jgi:hypothetical protein